MPVPGREEARAPAHRGLDAPGRGVQRRADAGGVRHVHVDAPPRAEDVARERLRPHDRPVARPDRVGDEPLAVESPVVDGDAVVPDGFDGGRLTRKNGYNMTTYGGLVEVEML